MVLYLQPPIGGKSLEDRKGAGHADVELFDMVHAVLGFGPEGGRVDVPITASCSVEWTGRC